jgi:hypothetical protein
MLSRCIKLVDKRDLLHLACRPKPNIDDANRKVKAWIP